MAEAVVWAWGLGGAGAIVGSFLAALALRWPEGRSVVRGRSACDACGVALQPIELMPLLSFAVQRGRCRHCGARIHPAHALIEGCALVIGASAGWVAPGWPGVGGAVFGWLLLVLAALDVIDFWLPDRLTALLAGTGVAVGLAGLAPDMAERLAGGVAGFAVLAGVAAGYRVWRGRQGMGGGDPKLFGAIGLWLGWRMLPAVLLIAALIGLGVVLFARVRGAAVGRDTAVPFGALLAVAAYPAWLAMVMVAS